MSKVINIKQIKAVVQKLEERGETDYNEIVKYVIKQVHDNNILITDADLECFPLLLDSVIFSQLSFENINVVLKNISHFNYNVYFNCDIKDLSILTSDLISSNYIIRDFNIDKLLMSDIRGVSRLDEKGITKIKSLFYAIRPLAVQALIQKYVTIKQVTLKFFIDNINLIKAPFIMGISDLDTSELLDNPNDLVSDIYGVKSLNTFIYIFENLRTKPSIQKKITAYNNIQLELDANEWIYRPSIISLFNRYVNDDYTFRFFFNLVKVNEPTYKEILLEIFNSDRLNSDSAKKLGELLFHTHLPMEE
jgi:hypothetical protein